MFHAVECPQNRLVPVSAYIIAAINSYSLNRFSLYNINNNNKKSGLSGD